MNILKILVCIKPAPDSESKITLQGGQPAWGAAPLVLSPFDGAAVEAALRLKDAPSASVMVLCIGGDAAREALKHTLAMGADEAILVHDPALAALDTQGAARLLAAAAHKLGADMLLFGRQTLDGGAGLTPAQTARALGWPLLSLAGSVSVSGRQVTVERSFEEGSQRVRAELPAVVSVTQAVGEPRYPSFLGIRKAAKANIQRWSLTDLGLDAPASMGRRAGFFAPVRDVPCEFISGDSPEEIAEKLAGKILAENVL